MLLQSSNQPDILEVIADLSNDEVFTPPEVANKILDLLPKEVWSNPDLHWLDPGSKTGVFLREIVKRLLVGLESTIADEQERLEHILRNMVFGIATTELTSLMTKRTLYCSKDARSPHSPVTMTSRDGNVWFERVEHSYSATGRCSECGASKQLMERDNRENYAYAFIHDNGRQQIRKDIPVKFDVIVGNPPYQMTDGGQGASASPIYQKFIEQAIELNPRYVAMIVPSRWFVGGKGLGPFRRSMLTDRRLSTIVDYQDARALFPNINLNGGVNYFLWDRNHDGPCAVTSINTSGRESTLIRELSDHDVFIRLNEAVSILEKVRAQGEPTFDPLVSPLKPFGFRTFYEGVTHKPATAPVELYQNGGVAWVERSDIRVNSAWVDKWKVLIPRATDGNENYPLPVLTEPIVVGPGTACTETYLVIGPCSSQVEAQNIAAYMTTRFFRFLLSLRKLSQDNSREKFSFIPALDMTKSWEDGELYNKYDITPEEQEFIAGQIKAWGA